MKAALRAVPKRPAPVPRRKPVTTYGALMREIDLLTDDAIALPKFDAEYESQLEQMLGGAERIHQRIRDLIADYKRP